MAATPETTGKQRKAPRQPAPTSDTGIATPNEMWRTSNVGRLLNDDELWNSIRSAAFGRIEREYSPRAFDDAVAQVLRVEKLDAP